MWVTRAVVVLALVFAALAALAARPAFALCTMGSTQQCHTGGGPGSCDVDTFCDGVHALCPDGVAAALGSVCRAAVSGGCDVAETCDGVSATCPTDVHVAPGTVCRAAVAGGCDVAETCNGSATCPMDVHVAPGTVCRAAIAGGCDVAEFCDGSATCPMDVHLTPGSVCRAAVAGGCDVAETCDGSATCPMDVHQAPGTVCRQAVPNGCTKAATCDGSVTCPPSQPQPDGNVCSDGNACTVGDACMSGACVAGGPPLIGSPVDFGPALVGGNPRSATLTLDWRDIGSVSVTALSPSSAEFRVAAGQTFPIALSSASPTATITMEFSPASLGARTGTVTATVSPATCVVPAIDLQGSGAPPGLAADPLDANFDPVEIGTTSPPKTFQIVNLSGADVVIQSVTVSDPDSFTVVADGLPAPLAADGAYSFTIAARPQTTGPHDAVVVITSNSPTAPMLSTTIHVEGTCTSATCEVDPGSGSGSSVGRERASYYACAAGHASAMWPLVLALALLRRHRRRAR